MLSFLAQSVASPVSHALISNADDAGGAEARLQWMDMSSVAHGKQVGCHCQDRFKVGQLVVEQVVGLPTPHDATVCIGLATVWQRFINEEATLDNGLPTHTTRPIDACLPTECQICYNGEHSKCVDTKTPCTDAMEGENGIVSLYSADHVDVFKKSQEHHMKEDVQSELRSGVVTCSASEKWSAVGDLHGDFKAAVGVLFGLGAVSSDTNYESDTMHGETLIDVLFEGSLESAKLGYYPTWTFGKKCLFQTGDISDRGPGFKYIMEMFMKLEAEAFKAGGRFVFTLGNHELWQARNAKKLEEYLHKDEEVIFGTMDNRIALLSPEEGLYGKWVFNHPLVALDTTGKTFFSHAGLDFNYLMNLFVQLFFGVSTVKSTQNLEICVVGTDHTKVMKEEVEALHHDYNMAGMRYREKNEADGDLKKVWIAAKAAWVAAVEAQEMEENPAGAPISRLTEGEFWKWNGGGEEWNKDRMGVCTKIVNTMRMLIKEVDNVELSNVPVELMNIKDKVAQHLHGGYGTAGYGTPMQPLLAGFETLKMPVSGAELTVLLNALYRWVLFVIHKQPADDAWSPFGKHGPAWTRKYVTGHGKKNLEDQYDMMHSAAKTATATKHYLHGHRMVAGHSITFNYRVLGLGDRSGGDRSGLKAFLMGPNDGALDANGLADFHYATAPAEVSMWLIDVAMSKHMKVARKGRERMDDLDSLTVDDTQKKWSTHRIRYDARVEPNRIVEDELDTIYEGLEEGEEMNAQEAMQLQREIEDLKKRLEEEQEAERLRALEEFFIPGHVEEETHRIGWWVHGDNRYVVTKAVHPGDAALPFLRLEIEDLKTTYGAGAFKVVRKGKLATLPGQDEFVDPSNGKGGMEFAVGVQQEERDLARREIDLNIYIAERADLTNIMPLLGYNSRDKTAPVEIAKKGRAVVTVTEFMKGGPLTQVLAEGTTGPMFSLLTYNPVLFATILFQMLLSVYNLHKINAVSLDLKTSNFLLKRPLTEDPEEWGNPVDPETTRAWTIDADTVQLMDFGLGMSFPDAGYDVAGQAARSDDPRVSDDLVGTPGFMCPEMLGVAGVPFTSAYACDIFSLGLNFAAAVCKRYNRGADAYDKETEDLVDPRLFDSSRVLPDLKDCILEGGPNATPKLLDLITKMIEINPKERQTAEQLLGHRYFKQIPVEARVLPQGVRDRSKLDLKTRLEDLKLKRDQLESSSRSSTSSVPLIEISLESLEQELEATDRNFAKISSPAHRRRGGVFNAEWRRRAPA